MITIPLALKPGVFKNGTKYQAKGRWFDSDLVRFLNGALRPIGGWQALERDVQIAEDTFTEASDTNLDAHTPTGAGSPGVGGWEYNGSSNHLVVASGPDDVVTASNVPKYARSTNDLMVLAASSTVIRLSLRVTRETVDSTASLGGFYIWGESSVSAVNIVGEGVQVGWIRDSPSAMDFLITERNAAGTITTTHQIQLAHAFATGTARDIIVTVTGVTLNVQSKVSTDSVYTDHGDFTMNVDYRDSTHLRAGIEGGGTGSGAMRMDNFLVQQLNEPVVVTGVPRSMHAWRASTNRVPRLAAGTETNLYEYEEGALTDITPAGFTTGASDSSRASGAYGSGLYGGGNYGVGDSTLATLVEAATWQLDNFGDILLACMTADGGIYEADGAVQATILSNAPTSCRGLVVTPERFVVALAAGGDARLVQWSDQEVRNQWAELSTNQAGQFPLQTVGEIMCGRRGRNETLIWTDIDLWGMRFIGGTLVYSFQQLGEHCGIIARNAVAVIDGRAAWMGQRSFFQYDGFVREIECDVSDHVFGRLNRDQRHKVVAIPLPEFGEVHWHYPSENSPEIDEYVIWNYREDHWTPGSSMPRVGGAGAGVFEYPIMGESDGVLNDHERGFAYGGASPFAETGPIEIGNGERVMMVVGAVPDESTLGESLMSLFTSLQPTDTEAQTSTFSARAPTDIRATGRWARLRVDGSVAQDWRVGTPRLLVQLGGFR